MALPVYPQRIAVLRTAALGDICMTIPLLIALRDHFTSSEINWILDENMSELVEDLKGIQLIKIKKPRSLTDWRDCQRKLSQYHFDALLMPQSSLRSNVLSLFINADIKYGYDKLHSKDCQSFFIDQAVTSVEEHLVDSFMRFAQALGVPPTKPRWEINLSASNEAKAVELLPNTTKPIIAICPVSSNKERNWPAECFAAVAAQLQRNFGAQIILVGGADKYSREACASIQADVHAINASNQTSLKELCAVLKRTNLLIAPDTGPAHLATAMGTPVIGLYAVMKAAKTGPYYSVQDCVDRYDEAVRTILKKDPRHTSWNLRVHSAKAMRFVTTDAVYSACANKLRVLGFPAVSTI